VALLMKTLRSYSVLMLQSVSGRLEWLHSFEAKEIILRGEDGCRTVSEHGGDG
jgi:hypothetical protein